MQIVYERFKGKEITYQDSVTGIVAGFTDSNLLLAVKTKPDYSFRRFGKEGHYIEEEYKSESYRYVYCNEKTAEEQCKQ